MSRKEVLVFFLIGFFITVGIALVQFMFFMSSDSVGFPFVFSRLNFFSASNTDYTFLLIDTLFWFMVVTGFYKLLIKRF